MRTKYGNYSNLSFSDYKKSLIDRIWCLIPLREEHCKTIDRNVKRINRELNGLLNVSGVEDKYIITVIHLLEHSVHEEDFSVYRSDILRCCELVKKIGGDDDV